MEKEKAEQILQQLNLKNIIDYSKSINKEEIKYNKPIEKKEIVSNKTNEEEWESF